MRAVLLWLLLFLVFEQDRATAGEGDASFNCRKSQTAIERTICSNDKLRTLDRDLAWAFRSRLAELDEVGRGALTKDQKHWLYIRDVVCMKRQPGLLITCLLDYYRARIGIVAEHCKVDEAHALEDMAKWDEPWSRKAPRGFTSEEHVITFEVPEDGDWIESYNLPSLDLPQARRAGTNLGPGSRGFSLCRVLGPDGRRWLAAPAADGNLFYVREDETVPAD